MKGGSQSSSHQGLILPAPVRSQLRQVGILARAEVGLEHQHLARRYVIRGVESGGATREMVTTSPSPATTAHRWLISIPWMPSV